MPRVVHFEFHSSEPESTTRFFREVFDWKTDKWDNPSMEYWMLNTGPADQPGIGGGLLRSRDGQPRTVCTIEVPDVDEHAKKVTAAGGQVVVPKMAIPGVGWVAYGMDPHGVLFGIYRHDESAR
jgi:hypothetical protein